MHHYDIIMQMGEVAAGGKIGMAALLGQGLFTQSLCVKLEAVMLLFALAKGK